MLFQNKHKIVYNIIDSQVLQEMETFICVFRPYTIYIHVENIE